MNNPAPTECLECRYQSDTGINGDCLLGYADVVDFKMNAPANCPYLDTLREMGLA